MCISHTSPITMYYFSINTYYSNYNFCLPSLSMGRRYEKNHKSAVITYVSLVTLFTNLKYKLLSIHICPCHQQFNTNMRIKKVTTSLGIQEVHFEVGTYLRFCCRPQKQGRKLGLLGLETSSTVGTKNIF